MKKSTEIVKLPIISISDGQEVGRVKSLVINPEKGSIDFLTIEHEDWQVIVKAIPFKKVIGIGEYAVTIESENAIIDLNEIPIANQLMNKKIKIIGSKVMTRKGQLLGDVKEFYVDEDKGTVVGTVLTLENEEVILAGESVLTYGEKMLIVSDDAKDKYVSTLNDLEKDEEKIVEYEGPTAMEEAATTVDFEEAEEALDGIHQKQLELLEGKTVTRDIVNKDGEVIIVNGTVLTDEEIARAQSAGPSIVVDLTMSVDE